MRAAVYGRSKARRVVVMAVMASAVVACVPSLGEARAPGLPRARTIKAIGVHGHEAVVTGVINPRGQVTRYRFQYGQTKSYGRLTEASEEVVVGNEDRKVAVALFRLTPRTTYHFRIIAFNRRGSVFGQDRAFTTTRR